MLETPRGAHRTRFHGFVFGRGVGCGRQSSLVFLAKGKQDRVATIRAMAARHKQLHPSVPSSNEPPMYEWAAPYWYTLRCAALSAGPVYVDGAGPADVPEPVVDEEATARKAVRLVGFFEGFCVTTPCAECRAHYTADWAVLPFTTEHALDYRKAMQWTEALHERIEARKRAERAGKTGPAATTATKPSGVPAREMAFPRKLGAVKARGVGGAGGVDVAAEPPTEDAAPYDGEPEIVPGSLQGHGGMPYRGSGGLGGLRNAARRGGGLGTRGVTSTGPGGPGGPAATAFNRVLAVKSALQQTQKEGRGCRSCGARKKK